MLAPWLLVLKLSVAAVTMPISVQPAASARSKPLRFSTSATYCTPARCGSACMTASASAICGTRLGCTKLATSMRRTPAAHSRSINSTLRAVGSTAGSLCKPSRGPTSTISMARFIKVTRAMLGAGIDQLALAQQHDEHTDQCQRTTGHHAPGELVVQQGDTEE